MSSRRTRSAGPIRNNCPDSGLPSAMIRNSWSRKRPSRAAKGAISEPHLLMDLVGQQTAECAQILQPDLQIQAYRLLLHLDLGDGGREHGLGADDGVGER